MHLQRIDARATSLLRVGHHGLAQRQLGFSQLRRGRVAQHRNRVGAERQPVLAGPVDARQRRAGRAGEACALDPQGNVLAGVIEGRDRFAHRLPLTHLIGRYGGGGKVR